MSGQSRLGSFTSSQPQVVQLSHSRVIRRIRLRSYQLFTCDFIPVKYLRAKAKSPTRLKIWHLMSGFVSSSPKWFWLPIVLTNIESLIGSLVGSCYMLSSDWAPNDAVPILSFFSFSRIVLNCFSLCDYTERICTAIGHRHVGIANPHPTMSIHTPFLFINSLTIPSFP